MNRDHLSKAEEAENAFREEFRSSLLPLSLSWIQPLPCSTRQNTSENNRCLTASCQIPTSHWRQRCMKSELTSLLPVAMTTAAFGKSPPTWGNSQVSPSNQNGLFYLRGNLKRAESVSAGLLCPTRCLCRSCQASQGWMWIRVR